MDELTAMLSERLSQEAAGDPLTTLLMQRLVAPTPVEDTGPGPADLRARLANSEHLVERLRAELTAADAMAAYVARVLGACPKCWGLDRFCRGCLGEGGPGTFAPDVSQLVEWVTPAFQRAGLTTAPIRPAARTEPTAQERTTDGHA